MKTPLTTRKVYGAWIIEDATGARIAVLAVAGPDDKDAEQDARQFVRAVNTYDEKVVALELAKEHLDAMRLESGMGNAMNDFERAAFAHVDSVLVDALSLAKGDQ